MNKDKKEIGFIYEEKAAEYLANHKVDILEKNYRCRRAEIDIIGMDRDTLVFFEVKYRSGAGMGDPLEAVNRRKRAKIRNAAIHYCAQHQVYDIPMRFDCIGIIGKEINWIKNAF